MRTSFDWPRRMLQAYLKPQLLRSHGALRSDAATGDGDYY